MQNLLRTILVVAIALVTSVPALAEDTVISRAKTEIDETTLANAIDQNQLLGTWDRYDPETGEKLNAYEFRAKGAEIEARFWGAFGEIVVPVQFDGKKVRFKYLYKTFNCDTEYEIKVTLESPGLLRGSLYSKVIRSEPGFPVRPGHKGKVATELRKR
jgi:hypothetical protein